MHNRRIVDDFSVLYSDDDTLFSLTRIGALNIFKARIERGDDLNRRTYCESHCIHLAADYGRLDFLNYFQELEVDLNLTDKFNNTALHRAISSREVEAALFLIEQGANINKLNSDGNSPLNLSLKFGFTIITNSLIERGARLNDKNVFGWTPLHFAVALGDIEILKTLCEAGANYTFIGKCNRYSALHLAADIGDIGIIDYFLSKRVDIDYRYESGYTILHTAVRNNHHDLARFLIENGAQVNLKTNKKIMVLWILLHGLVILA
ncbi:putative ankyrin repeat protein RF_0381 [Diorhabda sublineata]|uniref:putative ankyrin repeat protein RF_0381 n=1 Tax=Diorhabda sublineata TaxID=1163346 RepID=UPI0024E04CE5|nr:putative ankyrin repeat protein RF_0381 [Diorhabda sublineata]XP_056643273.1 putative ankyrin repeat protein RF_0381 [Diorhabda sublineata]XP_056643274.1 putative ankyrin repeat protein RF_0381 [Diorhabda sublineata]